MKLLRDLVRDVEAGDLSGRADVELAQWIDGGCHEFMVCGGLFVDSDLKAHRTELIPFVAKL